MNINKVTNNKNILEYKNKIGKTVVSQKNITGKDTVVISEEARNRLEQSTENISRENKIADIKKAIREGSYKVDSVELAQSLINFMKGNC